MENQQDSFLEVRLDPTGAAQLKRLSVTTRWLFIFGMALNLMLMVNALVRYSFVNAEKFIYNLPLYLEIKLHLWYVLLYCVLFTFQLRFYLRFVRQARMGTEKLDTTLFNNSFQFLNKANILTIVHISLSLFIGFLDVWANFNVSKMVKRH